MKKLTFNIRDERVTDHILSLVMDSLPKTGLNIYSIGDKALVVAVRDYVKTRIYDVYFDDNYKFD